MGIPIQTSPTWQRGHTLSFSTARSQVSNHNTQRVLFTNSQRARIPTTVYSNPDTDPVEYKFNQSDHPIRKLIDYQCTTRTQRRDTNRWASNDGELRQATERLRSLERLGVMGSELAAQTVQQTLGLEMPELMEASPDSTPRQVLRDQVLGNRAASISRRQRRNAIVYNMDDDDPLSRAINIIRREFSESGGWESRQYETRQASNTGIGSFFRRWGQRVTTPRETDRDFAVGNIQNLFGDLPVAAEGAQVLFGDIDELCD